MFYFKDPIDFSGEAHLHGTVEMARQDVNKRLYKVLLTHAYDDMPEVSATYEIP